MKNSEFFKGILNNHSNMFLVNYEEGARRLYKRKEDAGYDVYAFFKDGEDYKIIKPHETVIFNTGIKTAFPSHFYIQLEERGSTGVLGLAQRSGVIDSGYRGEWMIPITNTNDIAVIVSRIPKEEIEYDGEFIFYPYEKAISQAVIHRTEHTTFFPVSEETVKSVPSERGTGKIGSSGK